MTNVDFISCSMRKRDGNSLLSHDIDSVQYNNHSVTVKPVQNNHPYCQRL